MKMPLHCICNSSPLKGGWEEEAPAEPELQNDVISQIRREPRLTVSPHFG